MEIEKGRLRSMEKWEQRGVEVGAEWGKGVCEREGCTRG